MCRAATGMCGWTRCSSFADAVGSLVFGDGPLRASDLGRAAADRRRRAKDQAYMLAALSPASLARMRFPLAELTKPEVRELAASEAGLPVASRAESQDLCFLAGTGKARFLARHAGLEDVPGEIVTSSGDGRGGAPRGAQLHRGAAQGAWRGGGGAVVRAANRGDARGRRLADDLGVDRVRVRGARLHRPASEVDGVRLRYHAKSSAVSCARRGAVLSSSSLASRSRRGAGPGGVPAAG